MQIISVLIGGTIAALGGSSGINMFQSLRISQKEHQQPATANTILEQYISSTGDGKVSAPSNKSVDDIVADLQRLRRSEFLELWMACDAPAQNMKSVDGDWNGVLLDNNGLLMTKVSEFLTDALFGRKFDKWNGKAFRIGESGGINRFLPKCNGNDRSSGTNEVQYEHKFDCRVEKSKLDQSGEALVLQYANHQGRLSPWHSMRDEIRVLPINKGKKDGGILLGLGCMKWSGAYVRDGMLNSAPFCLYR